MNAQDRWALLGATTWLLAGIIVQPGWVEWLLLLSPLVFVPLLGSLLAAAYPLAWHWLTDPRPRLVLYGTAFLAVASFIPAAGLDATLLATPWAVCTMAAAILGLRWLLQADRTTDVWVTGAGLGFLSVGGAWLITTRVGARPLDFSPTIVLLTAMHFHHAGLTLPIIAGRNVGERSSPTSVIGGWGVIFGVPLTAAGITAGGTPEALAAWTMAAAGGLVAIGQIQLARSGAGRRLLQVSGFSLLAGMVLASIWAWGRANPSSYITLDEMARYHGSLNAFGFGLLGLIGWRIRLREANPHLGH